MLYRPNVVPMSVPYPGDQGLCDRPLVAHHHRPLPDLGRDDRPPAGDARDDQEIWPMASRIIGRVVAMRLF